METLHPCNWSELPPDILRSLLERLSFVDFQRAKMVCSNWYSGSKQTVPRKSGSPWLMLFPDDGGCVLYNPDKDRVYKTYRDFSGTRVLANYGNWFLVIDSRSDLYIIDVFSETRFRRLPSLESLRSSILSVKRIGDREFRWEYSDDGFVFETLADDLRGRLWVDEKTQEFVAAWFFDSNPAHYLCFCKEGNDHYTAIPLRDEVPKLLRGLKDLVLRDYRLYIFTTRRVIRVIDLSGQQGFEDITGSKPPEMFSPLGFCSEYSIAVTTAGEVLLVESTIFESHRSFRLYKMDPNADPDDFSPDLLEVDSLGDEALLLDLGITVPANHTPGIKPNSIYFTRHDRACLRKHYDLDICVFNLATKTLKRFPGLSQLNLKDAQWLLPMS